MKKLVLMCCVVLLMVNVTLAETDVVITTGITDISNNAEMENPWGGEVLLRHDVFKVWDMPVALGLSVGVQEQEVRDDIGGTHKLGWFKIPWSLDGDIMDVPLGVSAIVKKPIKVGGFGDVILTGQAGAKYHVMSDDLTYKLGPLESRPSMDDTVTCNFGLAIEKEVIKNVSLVAGVEYQYDLSENSVELNGRELFDNDLTGWAFRVGGAIKLNQLKGIYDAMEMFVNFIVCTMVVWLWW